MREPNERSNRQQKRAAKADRGDSQSASRPVIVQGAVPPRDVLLQFIADNPDKGSKREIAKAFGLKGDTRIELKDLLHSLEEDGLLTKNRKSLSRPGALPPVTVLDITTRDKDGELIGRPTEWPEDLGAAPAVLIRQSNDSRGKGKAPAAGLNDRILAKIFPNKDRSGPAYTARVIKVIDKRRGAALGVVQRLADGEMRLLPTERRGEEMVIEPEDIGDAKDGDLVESEVVRNGRFGLPRARVLNIVGSVGSEKAISMIAIYSHGIPHIFPNEVMEEAQAAKPASMSKREDWRDVPLLTIDPADAKDHDDAV